MINIMSIFRKSLCTVSNIRSLYTARALGVDGYMKTRDLVKSQFHDIEDKFKSKMKDFVTNDNHMIFTEDLKNMVHLVDEGDSDVDLVTKMMLKFTQQNKDLRFGNFVFGPVIMRMFHHLGKPSEALNVFKNLEESGFFDQLVSYQILLDLLFENKMYQEMLDIFEIIKKKQFQGFKYPKNVIVLIFAACYKINSVESFEFSKKLWLDLIQSGSIPMRRAATFAAALALQQNAPDVALEILTSMRQQNYVTIRNLKIAAFADLNRPDDALPIFKTYLEMDMNPTLSQRIQSFYEEFLEKMRSSIERVGRKELTQSYERIENELKALGCITNGPFSELLCSNIDVVKQHFDNVRDSYQKTAPKSRYRLRPGLDEDMS